MSLPAINESNTVSPTAVVIPKARLWVGRVLLWLFFAFMSMDTVIHLARPAFAVEATKKVGRSLVGSNTRENY